MRIIHTEHAKQREMERNSVFGCPPIVDIDWDIKWGIARHRMNKLEGEEELYIIRGRHYKYVVAIKKEEDKGTLITLITILYKRNFKKNEYRKYSTMTKQQIKSLIN